MDRNEQIRIEQLVSEIAEGVGNGEALKALDSLLLDRPDLQTYYARCLSMHMLLSGELADSHGYFPPLLRSGPDEMCSAASPRSDLPGGSQSTPASWSQRNDSRWLSGVLTAIALSLLVVVLFRGYEYKKRSSQTAATATAPKVVWHYDRGYECVWTEDPQAADLISRLTRTSPPSRLLLPSAGNGHETSPQLVGGTAWMEYEAGSRERGRLIPLPPNTTMDVFIDTDASSHNTLSIVELDDSTGLPVNANCSYGNVVGDQEQASLRSGWIGVWSRANTSSSTRYFLFTGAYLNQRTTETKYWAPSDFRIYIDTPELIIAGWDDRSYTIASEEENASEEVSLWQDCDYNDIRAIIRFNDLDDQPRDSSVEELLPAIDDVASLKVAEEVGNGFTFDVQPGEEVYLMVSGYAALQNAVQIVDLDNQRVLWRHEGIPLNEWTDQFPADRGVYVIRNLSEEVRQYELQASCLYNKKRKAWRPNPHRLLGENEVTSIVGFEDSAHSEVNTDWQDILVAIYRFDINK